jgi:hypothetical protein
MTGMAHFTCQDGRKHQNGASEIRRFRGRLAAGSGDGPRGLRPEGFFARFDLAAPESAGEDFRFERGQDGKCR